MDGAVAVDQLHDAALDAVLGEEAVLDMGNHVDQRVADADDLVLSRHRFFSSKAQRSRMMQTRQAGLRAVQV